MAEIAAVRPNGYRVVSTFSGCGGSCLGFKMAGFRVVYANEFIPAARETYHANHVGVPVDARDIRQVTAASIRDLAGLRKRDVVDVLEGSPPCASFSTAGKRDAGWGEVKPYSDTKQRVDDLFNEYVRLVDELRPRMFVAENVAGLVRGVAKGYFKRVLGALREIGYDVEARLLDAQWLGVPQTRVRLIFIGARADLKATIRFPTPLPYRYSIRDAIPGALGCVQGDNGRGVYGKGKLKLPVSAPAPCVTTVGMGAKNSYCTKVELDPNTSLEGYAVGREYDKLAPGEQSDRYFNLVRPSLDAPCPTITQLGGANPGVASVVHPTEKRKFTIEELRRLCGFPDDFVLTGSYPQQWERLGRAVPPPMMAAVAREVAKTLRSLDRR